MKAKVLVTVVRPGTSADLWLAMVTAFAADGLRVVSVVLLAEHDVPRPRELPTRITIEHVERREEDAVVTGEIDDGRRIRIVVHPMGADPAKGELETS